MHFIFAFRKMLTIWPGELQGASPCKTRRNKPKDATEHPLELLALCIYPHVFLRYFIISCHFIQFSFLASKGCLDWDFSSYRRRR